MYKWHNGYWCSRVYFGKIIKYKRFSHSYLAVWFAFSYCDIVVIWPFESMTKHCIRFANVKCCGDANWRSKHETCVYTSSRNKFRSNPIHACGMDMDMFLFFLCRRWFSFLFFFYFDSVAIAKKCWLRIFRLPQSLRSIILVGVAVSTTFFHPQSQWAHSKNNELLLFVLVNESFSVYFSPFDCNTK